MTKFTTPERNFELLKLGEGLRAIVSVRLPIGTNGAFAEVATWRPRDGLTILTEHVTGCDVLELSVKCAEEFVKG